MVLLILFIVIPIIEIALFIQVGGFLGLFPTLIVVIVTAVIGARAVKSQGMDVMRKLQGLSQMSPNVAETMTDGAFLILAGALLVTPGFFTDAIGFSLLVPKMRRFFAAYLRQYIIVRHNKNNPGSDRPNKSDDEITIEDYEIHDPKL